MKSLLSLALLAAFAVQAKAPLDTARVDFDAVGTAPSVAAPASLPGTPTALESSEIPTTRRLYLHPILTAISVASGEVAMVPVTYEQSLRPGRSFAIQPMVMFGSLSATDDNPPIDLFQVSVISQLRFYVNGKVPKRFYLAPALAVGYISNESDGSWKYSSGYARGMIAGIAGFLGWTFDEGMLPCDLNLGVGVQKVFGKSRGVRNFGELRPLLDLNLGLGFRL